MAITIYESDKVKLDQFAAGKTKGVMLQLTLLTEFGFSNDYVQLTKSEAVALSEILRFWATLPEPDKKNPPGEAG